MTHKIRDLELFAYVGEDENEAARVGIRRLKSGAPLIGSSRPPPEIRGMLQREVNLSGIPIYLVRVTVAEIIDTITPKGDA